MEHNGLDFCLSLCVELPSELIRLYTNEAQKIRIISVEIAILTNSSQRIICAFHTLEDIRMLFVIFKDRSIYDFQEIDL